MGPQNRSIRHFFTPVPAPRTAQVTAPAPAPATPAPAPAPATAEPPAHPASDSFSASQTSAHSGASKRVVSNGQQVVLNSDSDSDSLPDLDWGLATPKVEAPPTKAPSTKEPATRTPSAWPRHITRSTRDGDLHKPPPKKDRSAKRQFDQLMETAQKNLETERIIAEHKARLEAEDGPIVSTVPIDKNLLKNVVDDDEEDEDKADRLYAAMQRTGDIQSHVAYHFFESVPTRAQPKFPMHALPEYGWAVSFEESSARDQAFMTGFAQQIFRFQDLPQELASWMIDEICNARNDALSFKYLEILETHHDHLRTLLDRNRLDSILKRMGAKLKSLGPNGEPIPLSEEESSDCALPSGLKPWANLIRAAAPWLHNKARGHAFQILCHICIDSRVLLSADVLNSIQDALEAIVCQFPDHQKLVSGLHDIVPQLISRVTHPVLQKSLVCAFPTRTPLTAYLQRHLALSFLLYPTAVDVPLADSSIPPLIHQHLDESPDFRTSKDTNYSLLAARFTLLDVAIGPGLLSVPYRPLISREPTPSGSSPVLAPAPASSEVKEFNKEVDALAQHIKLLGNSIVEAGAAVDLTILDAKERSERLYYRLQHAVRVGGKKADNVFGGGDDDNEDRQTKMSRFFVRRDKASTNSV